MRGNVGRERRTVLSSRTLFSSLLGVTKMPVPMMPSDELVRLLREFRDSLLIVARKSVGPAVQAAAGAAAKLDNLALDTAEGKRTRAVIDRELSRVLLSLADKNA